MKYRLNKIIFFCCCLFCEVCFGQNDTDTLVKAMINNHLYKIEITNKNLKDKNNLSLTIKELQTDKKIFSQQFKENEYSLFKLKSDSLNTPGRLFLEVKFDGGGSGFQGNCYEIANHGSKFNLYPVYNLDELSLLYFFSDDEIIKLEGDWNFSENETHFSKHRYVISKYNYNNSGYKKILIGKTKFKYASLNELNSPKKVLIAIKKREPQLLKSIRL